MAHISEIYANKLIIAKELAEFGARAITITSIARIKLADARQIYTRMWGQKSNSGRTPIDHQWFIFNGRRRQHGALLLALYQKYRTPLKNIPDAHGLAITMTWRQYLSVMSNEPVISLERFNLLTSGWQIGWTEILKGAPSGFSSDNLRLINCRVCKVPHLAEAHYLNYVCQKCQRDPE